MSRAVAEMCIVKNIGNNVFFLQKSFLRPLEAEILTEQRSAVLYPYNSISF